MGTRKSFCSIDPASIRDAFNYPDLLFGSRQGEMAVDAWKSAAGT